jgi:hypothetical protein
MDPQHTSYLMLQQRVVPVPHQTFSVTVGC